MCALNFVLLQFAFVHEMNITSVFNRDALKNKKEHLGISSPSQDGRGRLVNSVAYQIYQMTVLTATNYFFMSHFVNESLAL